MPNLQDASRKPLDSLVVVGWRLTRDLARLIYKYASWPSTCTWLLFALLDRNNYYRNFRMKMVRFSLYPLNTSSTHRMVPLRFCVLVCVCDGRVRYVPFSLHFCHFYNSIPVNYPNFNR